MFICIDLTYACKRGRKVWSKSACLLNTDHLISSVTFKLDHSTLQAEAHLASLLTDLHPVKISMFWFVHYSPRAVEAKNIITDTTRSSCFHLMFVSKQLLTCKSPSIVQFTMCQYTKKCAFASIYITNNSNSEKNSNCTKNTINKMVR